MPLQRQSVNLGLRGLLALLCATAAVAIGSGLAFVSSQDLSDEAAVHDDTAATIEIDQIRLMINRAATDEIVVRVGVMSGTLTETDLDRAADRRTDAWSNAASQLAAIDNENVAPQVDYLLDLIDGRPPMLLTDLYAAAGGAQFGSGFADGDQFDIDFIDQAITLVLYEAFVAETDRSGPFNDLVHPSDAAYINEEIGLIFNSPGYLGPDPAAPLNDSFFFGDVGNAEGLDLANDVLAASDMWTIDQWTRAWAEGSNQPAPIPLADVSMSAARDAALVRADVDRRIESTFDIAALAGAEASDEATILQFVAIALGIVAVGGLGTCFALGWRRFKQTQTIAGTDPLTGAGNRHRLPAAEKKAESTNLIHHVAVVIDLDRFKLVNDTHGHAMGDRILVELTHQLQAVIDQMQVRDHELIRLGGDEFALTLHSTSPINTAALGALLERTQLETVTTENGEHIPLAFSFGCVEAEGSPSIERLLEAADLKAYDDKRRRRIERANSSQHSENFVHLQQ